MRVRREFTHKTVIDLDDDTWRAAWDDGAEVEVVAIQQRWYTTRDSTLPPGQVQAIGLRVKQDGSLGRTRMTRNLSPEEVEALPAHVHEQLTDSWPSVALPLHKSRDALTGPDVDPGEHHHVADHRGR